MITRFTEENIYGVIHGIVLTLATADDFEDFGLEYKAEELSTLWKICVYKNEEAINYISLPKSCNIDKNVNKLIDFISESLKQEEYGVEN